MDNDQRTNPRAIVILYIQKGGLVHMAAVWKITILGDAAVGKTSLRHKFMGESTQQDYLMTIGADFTVYRFKGNTLHIWDLAGQQKFGSLMKGYLMGTLGSLIVFDISEPQSFVNVQEWITKLTTSIERKIPFVLVGNKADLRGTNPQKSFIRPQEGKTYANSLSDWVGIDIPYIETSALTGENVELIFDKLTHMVRVHL